MPGIMAARLAEAGFTANTDALEHPQGFLHAISPTGTEDRAGECRAGVEWAILSQGLGIKKYPTCYCTHRAIDCVLDLVNSSPIKADEVEKVTVNISDYFSTVLRNHQPDTGLAAKFSIEFCMASGIVAQRVGLRELTDDFVRRPDIQALMKKVEIVTTPAYDPDLPGAAPHDQVTVRLASGQDVEGEPVARATGHPSRPLTDQQIFDKFVDCLDAGALADPGGGAVQAAVGDPVDQCTRPDGTGVYNRGARRWRSGAGSFLVRRSRRRSSGRRGPIRSGCGFRWIPHPATGARCRSPTS